MKKRIMLDTRTIRNLIALGENRIENIEGNHSGYRSEYRAEISRIKRSIAPLKAALAKKAR